MSVRFIHILKWFAEWGTHWICLCTSNLQFNCTFKTLLWKHCSWWRIKPLLFFFPPDAIRLGQIGKSVCKGVSRQVQVVSPAGFNGTISESCPELCTEAGDVWHTAARTQMSYSSVAVTHGSSYLGARGTDQGFYVILLFSCLCLYIAIRVVGKPEHGRIVWTNRTATAPPSQTASLEKCSFSDSAGEFCNSM